MIEMMEATAQKEVRNGEQKMEKDRKKWGQWTISRGLRLSLSHHTYVQDYLIICRVDKERISKERLAASG